jgi:hypothetical protein
MANVARRRGTPHRHVTFGLEMTEKDAGDGRPGKQ